MAIAVGAAPFALDADTVGAILLLVACFFAITMLDATRPGIVSAAGGVPLVGSGLRAWVDGALGSLRGYLYGVMQGALVAFSDTVDWLHSLATQLAATVEGFAELSYQATWKITNLTVPALQAQLAALAAQSAAGVLAQVLALVSAEQARAEAVEAALGQGIADAQSAIVTYVGVSTAAAVNTAEALFTQAEQDARALSAGAAAGAEGLFAQAEQDAQALYSQAVALTEAVAARVGLETQAGVSALEREVASVQSGLTALQAALAAAGILTGAGIIADLVEQVRAIRNSRCMQNCDALGNLADFSGALDAGILIALALAWQADQESSQPEFGPTLASLGAQLGGDIKAVVG